MSSLAERLAQARRARFVGRDRERSLFQGAIDAVVAGKEPTFLVLHLFGPGGVGKSSLLREFNSIAVGAGVTVAHIDCRNVEASPNGLALAVGLALGAPGSDPFALLGERQPALLLLDTYERLQPLDDWIRDNFLPQLPSGVLVVIASRFQPTLQWRSDPGWQALMRSFSLRNLSQKESRELLRRSGVPQEQMAAVLDFTHGHPLALSLVAEQFAQKPELRFEPIESPDIVKLLLEQFMEHVPSPLHRAAVEATSLVRISDEVLLGKMLQQQDEPASELFDWLRSLPFIEIERSGLFPHDLAREALLTDLRWRNPQRYRQLHRYAREHYMSAFEDSAGETQRRVLFDYIYLHRDNPIVRPYFEWQSDGLISDRLRKGDVRRIPQIVARFEGEEAADLAEYWLEQQPQNWVVLRDADGEPRGFLCKLALQEVTMQQRRRDPAVNAAWQYLKRVAPLRQGECATHFRFWLAADEYQSVSSVQSRIFLNMVQHYLTQSHLAYTMLPVADGDFWAQIFAHVDLHRIPEADYEIEDGGYAVYGHDWRVVPPLAWLTLLADREVESEERVEPPAATDEEMVVLSEDAFSDAVREALRDCSDIELLATNPLLRSRLVLELVHPAKSRAHDRATILRNIIGDAAAALEQNPRDQRVHLVIYHTYLMPSGTQEQTAATLQIPYSSYRRYLRQGVERITQQLWQRELGHDSV